LGPLLNLPHELAHPEITQLVATEIHNTSGVDLSAQLVALLKKGQAVRDKKSRGGAPG
jgi:hypothetical protein